MSKKNIRKHGRRKEFSTDISSLDEIPSTNTSSNDATGIESVGVKAEAADITGAEREKEKDFWGSRCTCRKDQQIRLREEAAQNDAGG